MMNSPFYRMRSVPTKVVSVPVHFISSEDQPTFMSRDSAAVKIQKVFRGFLVRKSIHKISSIRNEIVNIEQRMINNEFVNSIRENPKERLRVNESIMSLLFKLDSIRGFDSGVRDFRKSVTRKAIALQERIDSIAQPHQSNKEENECSEGEIDVDVKENLCDHEDETVRKQELKEEEEEEKDCVVSDEKHNNNNNNNNNKLEILEKVISENNDKMMKLMMEMSERNQMQTDLINSLTRRVDHLEKAFVIHDLIGNKKKHKKNNVSRRRINYYDER